MKKILISFGIFVMVIISPFFIGFFMGLIGEFTKKQVGNAIAFVILFSLASILIPASNKPKQ